MKTEVYEALGGETIEHACKAAVAQAIEHQSDVRFDFNETEMLATPQSDPEKMAKDFMDECYRSREEYKASPEGIAAEDKRIQKVRKHQVAIIEIIAEACECASMDDWMQWLKQFATSADYVGVVFDHKRVIQILEQSGFKNDCHVGQKPGWFNTRQRMGEYIAGQAINCLKNGMPPHPVTLTFVDKYFKMP